MILIFPVQSGLRRCGKSLETRIRPWADPGNRVPGVCFQISQQSGRGRGPAFRAPFPEVLVASAQNAAAQGHDGVSAVLGPAHAALLQPPADDRLARAFHHAGADLEALGAELVVAHALAVGFDVADALGRGLAAARMGSQRRQQACHPARLQVRAARFGPLLAAVAVAGEQGLGDLPELLGSVEEVHDLNRAGVEFGGDRPDPLGAVAHDDLPPGPVEAAPRGLAPQAAGKRRRDGIGVAPGRAVNAGRVGHRARVPDRAALLVAVFGGPQHDDLPLPRACRAVALLAGPAAHLLRAHRHAGAVGAEIHGRGRGVLAGEHLRPLGGGDLAAERLGGAFGALDPDMDAGQFRQQLAGVGEADLGRGLPLPQNKEA